jgi:hypothetical protein
MQPGLKPNRKGERRGGRKRGTPNKTTASVREAIALAFDGIGGVPALIRWARRNRDPFYTRMLTRLLPTQVDSSVYMHGMPTLEESRQRMRQIIGVIAPELKDDDDDSDDGERHHFNDGMNGGDGER